MPAPSSGTESINLQGNPPPVAPGLRILIRGADELRPEPAPAPAELPKPQPQPATAIALLAADAALLTWPAVWILTHPQTHWPVLLASILSISLAACCGILAVKAWRGI
jgi:hypothetical protein